MEDEVVATLNVFDLFVRLIPGSILLYIMVMAGNTNAGGILHMGDGRPHGPASPAGSPAGLFSARKGEQVYDYEIHAMPRA